MLAELDEMWKRNDGRLSIIPGKEALGRINAELQAKYKINVTITGIIDAMHVDEVPSEVKGLVEQLHNFSKK